MKSIYTFLLESLSGTSDDSLYYRNGINRLLYMTKDRVEGISQKFGIPGEVDDPKNRGAVIKYGRSISYPLLPDEMEVIPRKDWKLDVLGDVCMEALYHPHKAKVSKWDMEHFNKRHDYFLCMQCTNAKPYCSSQVATMWGRFRDYVDFGSFAFGIEPWSLSNLYPGRWLEWDHMNEDHYMHFLYCEQTIKGILEFQKKHQYKKMFVFCQHPYPQDPVTWMMEENIDNCRDWIEVITTPEFRDKVQDEYPQLNRGTYIMRMPGLDLSRKTFVAALSKEITNEDDRKKLKSLIDDSYPATSINYLDPDIAKKAYADGCWPDDPEWIEKYEKQLKEENE